MQSGSLSIGCQTKTDQELIQIKRRKVELTGTLIAKKWWQHCQTSFAMETHRADKATEEEGDQRILGEETGVRNGDNTNQVQL